MRSISTLSLDGSNRFTLTGANPFTNQFSSAESSCILQQTQKVPTKNVSIDLQSSHRLRATHTINLFSILYLPQSPLLANSSSKSFQILNQNRCRDPGHPHVQRLSKTDLAIVHFHLSVLPHRQETVEALPSDAKAHSLITPSMVSQRSQIPTFSPRHRPESPPSQPVHPSFLLLPLRMVKMRCLFPDGLAFLQLEAKFLKLDLLAPA